MVAGGISVSVEFHPLESAKEWDDLMQEWPSSTIYHRTGWITAVEKAFRRPCTRLVGTERGRPILAFPLFRARFGPVTSVISPPPSLGIEFLGPILSEDLLSGARDEIRRLDVFRAALTYVQEEFRPSLTYFRLVPALHDARAFRWSGYDVDVLYTYILDVTKGPELLLKSFHPSVRRDIRRIEGKVEVRAGGKDLCARVHDFVSARFRAQGMNFGPSRDYLLHLYNLLGPSAFQPLGAYTSQGLEAGAIVTFHGRRAGFWQHSGVPASSHLPLTTALVWQALRLAAERGCAELELVGANTPRLVEYKSKFRPSLYSFLEVSKATVGAKSMMRIYRKLRG